MSIRTLFATHVEMNKAKVVYDAWCTNPSPGATMYGQPGR